MRAWIGHVASYRTRLRYTAADRVRKSRDSTCAAPHAEAVAQRWFMVTPTAIYELTSTGRLLRSWPADGMFDQLIICGYPATLLPVDLAGATGLPDEDEEQIFFVDLAVREAPSRFTVTVCIPGSGICST